MVLPGSDVAAQRSADPRSVASDIGVFGSHQQAVGCVISFRDVEDLLAERGIMDSVRIETACVYGWL